jgi:hypothetical protein
VSTSFASIVNDVYTLTNRPDLVNETALAVKAATLKAHQKDDWIKDFNESSIQFTTSDFYQSLDYKSIIPLWRKPRYIRNYDPSSTGGAGSFLKYIPPEQVTDGYGYNRTDVFYVAGSNIQIRTSQSAQYFLVGYYVNPDVSSTGYKSWIADDHPFAITYEAVAIILKSVGMDEQVVTYRSMVEEQMQMLTQHAITGTGM